MLQQTDMSWTRV